METLASKVEEFILNNTTPDNGVRFKDIVEHFVAQGYANSDVNDAMRVFFSKHAAKVTPECD